MDQVSSIYQNKNMLNALKSNLINLNGSINTKISLSNAEYKSKTPKQHYAHKMIYLMLLGD